MQRAAFAPESAHSLTVGGVHLPQPLILRSMGFPDEQRALDAVGAPAGTVCRHTAPARAGPAWDIPARCSGAMRARALRATASGCATPAPGLWRHFCAAARILFDASTSLKKRSRNPRRVMRACRPVSAAQGCIVATRRNLDAAQTLLQEGLERTAGAVDLVACGGILDGASWRACAARAAQYWSALVWRGPLAAALILREGQHGQ